MTVINPGHSKIFVSQSCYLLKEPKSILDWLYRILGSRYVSKRDHDIPVGTSSRLHPAPAWLLYRYYWVRNTDPVRPSSVYASSSQNIRRLPLITLGDTVCTLCCTSSCRCCLLLLWTPHGEKSWRSKRTGRHFRRRWLRSRGVRSHAKDGDANIIILKKDRLTFTTTTTTTHTLQKVLETIITKCCCIFCDYTEHHDRMLLHLGDSSNTVV